MKLASKGNASGVDETAQAGKCEAVKYQTWDVSAAESVQGCTEPGDPMV